MTKIEIAELLVEDPNWGGSKDIQFLVHRYSKEELEDALEAIDAELY